MTRPRQHRRGSSETKLGHVPVSVVDPRDLAPAPENDELYRPVLADDPEIVALAESIREHGVREPLVASVDGFILSGHRRRMAAIVAGVDEVPVRYETAARLRSDGTVDPAFVVLLREYNRQRDKSLDEKLREEIVSASPDHAHEAMLRHRKESAALDLEALVIRGETRRSRITKAKAPFLAAILRVIEEQRDFLPLSDRRIHYGLLNDPPLKHARKPETTYANDRASYKSLVELLTRARLAGRIPMHVISDDTRPFQIWTRHTNARAFIRSELHVMFKGYRRDLLRSQPNHVEILVEKNTVEPIIRPIAERYSMPITSGRGFCSLPPRAAMAKRFRESGKEQLVILFATDFDPDGEEIAHSFARSMRDDFGIERLTPIKVALTFQQVTDYRLHPNLVAKEGSSRFAAFVAKYGHNVYELEALPPAELQRVVQVGIDEVLDVPAFNAELDAEKNEAAYLDGLRQRVHLALRGAL